VKATKVMVFITVECLHTDTVSGIVQEALYKIATETPEGRLIKDDGDNVSWHTKLTPVEF